MPAKKKKNTENSLEEMRAKEDVFEYLSVHIVMLKKKKKSS